VHTAELLLLLLIAVAALVTLARRLRTPDPALLLIGGLALGAIPGGPRLEIAPDAVLPLVLPPILYFAAFFTPVRSFRAELGHIVSLAIGLVLASTAAAAGVALALVPGMTVPIAIALGAIVSPPDAVAATAVIERLAVPRRVVALLHGESLLNDATALTVYRVALSVAVAAIPAATLAPIGAFAVAGAGGIAIGLGAGWLIAHVRARLSDLPVEITVSLLTPYAAYLPAELVGASGVLAAVTAGLYLGRRSSLIMSSDVRLAGRAVWEMLIFLLNGVVFVLIGFQMTVLGREMETRALAALVAVGLAVSVALIAVRGLWIVGIAAWQRVVSRAGPALRPAEIVVLTWAGMRGVVSLAAALALPLALPGGVPLPAREAAIVITFTVIFVTLVGQGMSLPLVIRAVHLGGDGDAGAEELQARRELVDEALRRIDALYAQWPGHRPLLDALRATYRHRAEHIEQLDQVPQSEAEQELVEHRQIRRAVIDAQREAVLRMRDRGAIDDDVLRSIERELDLEEVRMEA
jgi:CPA1 family monovalent cation:H+ antiporter